MFFFVGNERTKTKKNQSKISNVYRQKTTETEKHRQQQKKKRYDDLFDWKKKFFFYNQPGFIQLQQLLPPIRLQQ